MNSSREAKPGGIRTISESTGRRREEKAAFTAERRDHALQKKRLRRDASGASLALSRGPSDASLGGFDSSTEADKSTLGNIIQQVETAVQAVNSAKPIGSKAHRDAVRALRHILSDYEDPPYQSAVAAGAVPALISALQPPVMDAVTLETLVEAAWALSNLAVGEAGAVAAVLPAAPILIAYVSGSSGLAVAEQCARALGNISGEDAGYREILIANGAVRPLTELMMRGARAASQLSKTLHTTEGAAPAPAPTDEATLATGATAAWALANLLRGAGQKEVGQLMATQGAGEALVRAVGSAPNIFAVEAAWVVAYATNGPLAHLNRFISLGLIPQLLSRIESSTNEMLSGDDDVCFASQALLTPLLHALGNVAAGGGSTAAAELLAPERVNGGALKSIVVCAESRHHGLQRLASWILASIAGFPGRDGLEVLKLIGAIPVLKSLLKEQPFQVRKEAAFALANVAAGGGGCAGDAEAMNSLFGTDIDAVRAMVSLMRSADADAALLGLQFTEMLLRLLPSGVREVEAADGIDALEALQFGSSAPEEVKQAAAALVDRYWSIDAMTTTTS